jgi:diguanylate cyclase (GGDEF)-like protein
MSFRNRLTLFFVVIVIVPMIAVALVLFRLISDNETGKADAGVAAASRAATGIYKLDATSTRTRGAVAAVGNDRRLDAALARRDVAAATRRARELLTSYSLKRLAVFSGQSAVIDVGDPTGFPPIFRLLKLPNGRPLGQLELSLENAAAYARRVGQVTGQEVVVSSGDRVITSTLAGAPPNLPRVGDVTVADRAYRTASFRAQGFGGQMLEISVLTPRASTTTSITHGRLLAAILLAGFFLLAFAFALAVSRSLQQQIAGFLDAARRLGGGDFAVRVPAGGHDEFALLGEEFNRMSHQLKTRLEELRQQRERLERSLQRIGETFASNLDRDALLGIVLRTAVDGVGAVAGRATARAEVGAPLRECASVGPVAKLQDALRAAEGAALDSTSSTAETVDGMTALAHALRGADVEDRVMGMISVARDGRPFEPGVRELFDYLVRQAGVSIENVGLHERVQEQAVTDALTGLYNHRRFRQALSSEAERARRFDQPVGLVMLDLDDFKAVNDAHGHQHGDRVLKEVAHLMQDLSREIDAPARYGGEELAIVLPGTDLDGAYKLGERLRKRIAELEIPKDGDGEAMRITASIGVAALPASAPDPDRLIAAADAALYEAKRAGKNKTVRAR